MKNLSLIGMPLWFGCDVFGGEKTFDLLQNDFENIFKNNKIGFNGKIPEIFNPVKFDNTSKLKYLDATMTMNKNLYDTITSSFSNNLFPIILGGDHALAIGSVSASLDFYDGDVSLIWIDAHTDIHTDIDSPSGNIHGIPISVCMGRCANPKLQICKNKLNPSNIFYIGCRDNDKSREKEEKDYIVKENIYYSTDTDLFNCGVENVINDVINKINTKYVHISFDFDSIKDDEFPAVNVLETSKYVGEGGITFEMANNILKKLLSSNLNISAIDFVEYNPRLDVDFKCFEKFKEILKTVDASL